MSHLMAMDSAYSTTPKIRTYAVDRLNVISSDGRSEKSRQSQLANTGFRDFSSLTCPTAGAGRSSK
jgi:hypothetical protein